MSDIERRMLCKEVRVDMKAKKIRGYAAVFNTLSGDLGGFREQLSAGAFTDALATADVRALINHDSNYVLGRSTAGTLTMREDDTGLYVEISPPDTQAARDLMVSMERGDVSQMSFAFTVDKEGQAWKRDGQGPWVRTIKRVSGLYDVSVVTYPAYVQTTAAVRALEEVQAGEAQEALAAAKEVHKRESRKRQIDLAEHAI